MRYRLHPFTEKTKQNKTKKKQKKKKQTTNKQANKLTQTSSKTMFTEEINGSIENST